MALRNSIIILCLFIISSCSNPSNDRNRVLIVTGQNNHNWEVSHVAIKTILENSGLFDVEIAISPKEGEGMSDFILDFTPYQLVVIDYNGDEWAEKTKYNFESYASNGGGIIFYHASDNAFPHWAEYNKMCALGGWEGRNENSGPYVYVKNGELVKDQSAGQGGSHGAKHKYLLKIYDKEHPIVKGLPARWLHAKDELYDRMRGPGNIASLLYTAYSDPDRGGSGREEPLLFTVDYKNARIFHTMLGHAGENLENNPAMQCAGFQTTLLRGAEWAATGKVTQPIPIDFPTEERISIREKY